MHKYSLLIVTVFFEDFLYTKRTCGVDCKLSIYYIIYFLWFVFLFSAWILCFLLVDCTYT